LGIDSPNSHQVVQISSTLADRNQLPLQSIFTTESDGGAELDAGQSTQLTLDDGIERLLDKFCR
jgi:hypothetical protein